MNIQYQIRRIDLIWSYLYNLRYSRITRIYILGFAGFVYIFALFIIYTRQRYLGILEFITALILGIGSIFILPLISFITAKTQMRILTINPEGIETSIGKQKGKIIWQKISSINITKKYIIITGNNANAFVIPSKAFENDELRTKFIDLSAQYRNMASYSS